jgi:radical SAM protein with 4Fe4S-binding SPASM domain
VPEYCEYRQGCSNLLTAEWNGDVYPCDFFVEERYRMGSVLERTLQQMLGGGAWREFVRRAEHVPSVCRGCEWLAFCHAGCYRHRSKLGLGPDERPYPCAANERIFGHVFGRFNEFEARPGRPRLHEFLNRLERNIAAGASRSAAGNGRRQTGGPKRARLLRGALAPGKGSMREAGKIEVAILGKTIYVRASGYATQANSLGLPDILATMFGQGCTSVTFDLKKCRGMDSTFMGVIAGAAISRTRPSGKAVAVINTNDKTRQELAFIGLLPVIALVEDEVALPEELRLARASTVHWPKTERARITKIKKLHENLIALNEKNKELFGAVIEMLETELRQENSSE